MKDAPERTDRRVILFHNDEAGYAAWLHQHEHEGVVLAEHHGEWMAHAAHCAHINYPGDGHRYMRWRKVCALQRDQAQLDQYSLATTGHTPLVCSHC